MFSKAGPIGSGAVPRPGSDAMSSAPSAPSKPIAVVVAGALGRMGAEVIRAVVASPDCTLVGAIAARLPPGADQEAARLRALQVWAISHGVASLERAGMPPPGSGAPPPEQVLGDAVMRLLGMR